MVSLQGDMLVQEYTCSLCGLSSKDFLVLKKHMKDAHGKDIGHGIFSHGPKENKSVSIRGDDNEATPEKESSKETNWQKPEELLSHLPKDTKNAFDKMLMTGLTRCMFCGKENTDLNDMVAHVMKEHGNEIEKMKGNLEFMPSSQDMNELLGNLGNITSMLIGQLGGAMENGDGESMKKMFTAMIPDEDTPDGVSHWTSGDLSSEEDPNISGDGDMPDIDGIMEIALEVGMKAAGEMLGGEGNESEEDDNKTLFWDKNDQEKGQTLFTDDEKLVRECPECGNFIKIGDPVCPFCKKDIK